MCRKTEYLQHKKMNTLNIDASRIFYVSSITEINNLYQVEYIFLWVWVNMRKKIKCLWSTSYLFRVTALPLYFILLSQNVKNRVVGLRSFSLWYSTTTTLLKAWPFPAPGDCAPSTYNPGGPRQEFTMSVQQTWAQEPQGYMRTAQVAVPATSAGQKVPVVFHFHGAGGHGNTHPFGNFLGHECIIVAPDGYQNTWSVGWEYSWSLQSSIMSIGTSTQSPARRMMFSSLLHSLRRLPLRSQLLIWTTSTSLVRFLNTHKITSLEI